MTNNPWIEWSKQPPTEKDLPIEYADYGDPAPRGVAHSVIMKMAVEHYPLWRSYCCDIPSKPPATVEPIKWNCFTCNRPTEDDYKHGVVFTDDVKDGSQSKVFHRCPIVGEVSDCTYWRRSAKQPQPDARGWWRIEDRKPKDNQTIKFKIKNVQFIHFGYYQNEGTFISQNSDNETDEIDVEAWCSLDMSGPVED